MWNRASSQQQWSILVPQILLHVAQWNRVFALVWTSLSPAAVGSICITPRGRTAVFLWCPWQECMKSDTDATPHNFHMHTTPTTCPVRYVPSTPSLPRAGRLSVHCSTVFAPWPHRVPSRKSDLHMSNSLFFRMSSSWVWTVTATKLPNT